MINPNYIFKTSFSTAPIIDKKISIQKLTGFNRSRWDEPIEVPQILYQKFKIQAPKNSLQTTKKVSNNYPSSLIDYIKKSYNKCKDQPQKKQMENQLRQIISKNQSNLFMVNWQAEPLPNLSANQVNKSTLHYNTASIVSPGMGFSQNLKKQTIKLPPSYTRSLLDNPNSEYHIEELPSKTNLKSIKAVQKLQQKFNKSSSGQGQSQQGKLQNQQKKSFKGFQEESQVKAEQMRQRYLNIQAAQKQAAQLQAKQKNQIILNNNRFVPPPPPAPVSQNFNNNQIKINSTNNFTNKSSKNTNSFNSNSNSKQYSEVGLKIVQSTQPDMSLLKKNNQKSRKYQSTKNNQNSMSKITRKQLSQIAKVSESKQDLKTIAKRFTQFNKNIKSVPVSKEEEDQYVFFDQDSKIVGRSTQISKPYLRITHRPDPDTVRPQMILRQAFEHFKGQYKRGVSYQIIISQFKSIRQDLTVQDIRNSFTAQVYQQNMKMSLFQEDSIQLKHCMTNLWQLYRQGIYNKKTDMVKFISYHFITIILQERYKELEYMLSLLKSDVLQQDQIQQTLKVKRFFLLGNYRAFFDFYSSRDIICQKLMNQYMDKIRIKCLLMVCKTFGDKIKFSVLAQNIGQDEDLLFALARDEGAKIQGEYLMLKESYEPLSKSEYLVVKKVTSLLG